MTINQNKKKTTRSKKYEVNIIVEVSGDKTIAQGQQEVKNMMKELCLNVNDVKPIKYLRTIKQNNSLHKWCELMAQELEEKHIDKREFFKEPFFLSWTTDGVKNDIWRPIQKSLTGKKSTTKLDKLEEINLIWNNINRIIIEKYKGQVKCPPFPSYENE